MMDKMKKLLEKKAGNKPLHPTEKHAKIAVLHHLKKDMESMLGDKLKSMKKVTVAAPDDEGLEHGLDEASHLVKSKHLLGGEDEETKHLSEEGHEDGAEALDQEESTHDTEDEHENEANVEHEPEQEDESEDLDAKIEELMKKKAARDGKKKSHPF